MDAIYNLAVSIVASFLREEGICTFSDEAKDLARQYVEDAVKSGVAVETLTLETYEDKVKESVKKWAA